MEKSKSNFHTEPKVPSHTETGPSSNNQRPHSTQDKSRRSQQTTRKKDLNASSINPSTLFRRPGAAWNNSGSNTTKRIPSNEHSNPTHLRSQVLKNKKPPSSSGRKSLNLNRSPIRKSQMLLPNKIETGLPNMHSLVNETHGDMEPEALGQSSNLASKPFFATSIAVFKGSLPQTLQSQLNPLPAPVAQPFLSKPNEHISSRLMLGDEITRRANDRALFSPTPNFIVPGALDKLTHEQKHVIHDSPLTELHPPEMPSSPSKAIIPSFFSKTNPFASNPNSHFLTFSSSQQQSSRPNTIQIPVTSISPKPMQAHVPQIVPSAKIQTLTTSSVDETTQIPATTDRDSKGISEDRIAERLFALLHPTLTQVAEIQKTQQGLLEMIEGIKGRLDAGRVEKMTQNVFDRVNGIKERLDTSEENNKEKEKETLIDSINADSAKNSLKRKETEKEKDAGPTTNHTRLERDQESNCPHGSDKGIEGQAIPAPDVTVKSILILADRVHQMVQELGDIKHVLGVPERFSTPIGPSAPEENIGPFAMQGRKRRRSMLAADADRNKDNGNGPEELDELMIVNGERISLATKSTVGNNMEARSILERLGRIEMDLQECLEKANDPLASNLQTLVVPAQGHYGNIHSKAQSTLDPRTLTLMSTTKHEPKVMPTTESASVASSLTPVLMSQGLGHRQGETTAAKKPRFDQNYKRSDSYSENEGVEYVQEDVFGPLQVNSSSPPAVDVNSHRASSAGSNLYAGEQNAGVANADEDEDAEAGVDVRETSDVNMVDANDGQIASYHVELSPARQYNAEYTTAAGRIARKGHVTQSNPRSSPVGKEGGNSFSTVNWPKAAGSKDQGLSEPVTFHPTPKIKLGSMPSPSAISASPSTSVTSVPVGPFKHTDLTTPARSYSLPVLPEGSIAALRQETLGMPYLNFEETRANNQQQNVEGKIDMVMGAEAGENIPSPQSQFSDQDIDEERIQENSTEVEMERVEQDTHLVESQEGNQHQPETGQQMVLLNSTLATITSGDSISRLTPPPAASSPIHTTAKIGPPKGKKRASDAAITTTVLDTSTSQLTAKVASAQGMIMKSSQPQSKKVDTIMAGLDLSRSDSSLFSLSPLSSPDTDVGSSYKDEDDGKYPDVATMVRAKEELITPRRPLRATGSQDIPKADIIDIDSIATPKQAKRTVPRKGIIVKRDANVIYLSSDSEGEAVKPKTLTSQLTATMTAGNKRRSEPKIRGKVPVKLKIFPQPGQEVIDMISPERAGISSASSHSLKDKVKVIKDDVGMVDRVASEHDVSRPLSSSSHSMIKSTFEAKQSIALSLSPVEQGKHLVHSPSISEPPGSDSESELAKERSTAAPSFDINIYAAKLAAQEDSADIIRVKSKSSGQGKSTVAEPSRSKSQINGVKPDPESSVKSKSGLQSILDNKKRAKGSSGAATKIKKRKRVSEASSLGNGIEEEDEGWEGPPLKRARQRSEVEKEKEVMKTAKEKGKGKEADKPAKTLNSQQHNESARGTTQSRYQLRSPQKTASMAKSSIITTHQYPTKTPTRRSRDPKPVAWPAVKEPDFTQHIECDICESWYHIGCVGVEVHDVRLQPSEIYQCPMCEAGVDRKTSPSECARPDCLHQKRRGRSKSQKLSPSLSRTGRRSNNRQLNNDQETNDEENYTVDRFIGRHKKFIGGQGLVFEYLVMWLDYDFHEATWEILSSMGLKNPGILVDSFEEAAKEQGYDLQNGHEEVILLEEATNAGWRLDRTYVKPEA